MFGVGRSMFAAKEISIDDREHEHEHDKEQL
jgi:hypothetical protein